MTFVFWLRANSFSKKEMKAPLDRGSAQHGAWPKVSGWRPTVDGRAESGDPRTTGYMWTISIPTARAMSLGSMEAAAAGI
jgi:hypothetical protein